MINFKKYLLEKKDHIINKIPSLTDDQKKEIIDFFNTHSNLENKINWNNFKNLKYDDFKKILFDTSKTQEKKNVKEKGIKGLILGKDYLEGIDKTGTYNVYIPLNYKASKFIASKYIGECEGEWCTAYQKEDKYWNEYTSKGIVFLYIVNYTNNTKYAIAYNEKVYAKHEKIEIFDQEDNTIDEIPNINNIDQFLRDNEQVLKEADSKIEKPWYKLAETEDANYIIDTQDDNNITWKDGTWKDGTWYNGTWEKGTWLDGTWEFGIWEAGYWEKGTWKNGTWEFGTWEEGTWEGGNWESGWIYDPDKKGNFKDDWKWNGKYVESPISPKEYFSENNISETFKVKLKGKIL